MVRATPSPSPARAALVAAIKAVRDRADERIQNETAVELAEQEVSKSWSEISEIEDALIRRPETAAEALLKRARGHHITALIQQQILDEEPQSSRDLKNQLTFAHEILEDRRRVRDELKARIEKFDMYDYTTQRAKEAARAVVREESAAFIGQKISDVEFAMMTLARARADLGWFQSHGVFGENERDLPPALREALSPRLDIVDQMYRAARAGSAWSTVIDGLLADPEMPLPALEK